MRTCCDVQRIQRKLEDGDREGGQAAEFRLPLARRGVRLGAFVALPASAGEWIGTTGTAPQYRLRAMSVGIIGD